MRLLDVHTLKFSDFPSKIPKYVIASHRWVAGAEVMFASVQAGTQMDSYGYRKVQGFAEYIKTHMPGINWFWIDTCCIDQKSSSELSEAINSMFRWYRNAEVCLAHLHDVPVAADMAGFETSVWFRRGWTLQELLAPSLVVFLSQDWQIIGHKGRGGSVSMLAGPLLNDRIAEITQIPEPILRDYEASRALSVQEKLMWMANRQTTREEDLSYALLGILDVSMNIRYGDGMERTRERLYKKVQSRLNNPRVGGFESIQRGQSPGLGFIAPSQHRSIPVSEVPNDMVLIRRWLSPPPGDSVDGTRLQSPAPGSCKWITHTSSYREWLSNNPPHDHGKVFWVHGPAGLGKSVLNVDMIRDLVTREKLFVACYFTSAENVGHAESVLRSWLEQCAELDPVARAIILDLVPQQRPGATVTSEELWGALKSVASAAGRRIFVLDGLDQYSRNFDFRKAFLERLLRTFVRGQARVLITSRDERDLRSAFYPESVTDPRPMILEHRVTPLDVQADVSALTKTMLLQKFPALSQEERSGLVTHIVERSDGMFSWLKLLEQRLSSGQSADEVRDTVTNTVSELDESYLQKLRSVARESPDVRECAGKMLAWVMYASAQIDSRELQKALDSSSDRDKSLAPITLDKIVSVFDGLLQEQPTDQTASSGVTTIGFVHSSLSQCLAVRLHDRSPDESLSWIMIGHDAHLYLTRLCIDQLDRAQPSQWKEVADATPQAYLLRYAAQFWHVHASSLPPKGVDLCALFGNFLSVDNPRFVAWSTFFESYLEYYEEWQTRPADTPPPLYYAVRFNLFQILPSFKDKWLPTLNQVGGVYGTALQCACGTEHMQVFELLMEWNADVNIRAGRHGSAIHAAGANGNEEMVTVLIARNADLAISNHAGCTPLHIASVWRQTNVVKLLAKKGASISTVDNLGWTPLHEASNNEHLELVRFLADEGARISTISKDGWTPFALATWTGHVEIAKLLTGKGASISMADEWGQTPLLRASENGQLEMVKFLVSRGADVSTTANSGLSAVSKASSGGHLEVVMFLVSQGADISAASKIGATPLHNASSRGHLEVVKFLIEKGADISARNKDGCTPLYGASYCGHLKIVEFLFSKGADVLAETNDGDSPLSGASIGENPEVIKFLIDKGANISKRIGNASLTPLWLAARHGRLEVVKCLADRGADISAASQTGCTPLYIASCNGHLEIVKFLINKGANISTPTYDKSSTPLMTAAYGGHLEVVQYLVERGADVSTSGSDGFTALHHASLAGNLDVVSFLASKGAQVSSVSTDGTTPLHTAADKGNLDLAKLLVGSGARVLAENNSGQIPLEIAIVKGLTDVAAFLKSPEVMKLALAERIQKGPSKGSSDVWSSLKHRAKQIGKR